MATDNDITTGTSTGTVWVDSTTSSDVYITDGTGTDWSLTGAGTWSADLALGNIKLMVTESGEVQVIIDEVEYHFSKQKVKSFLEKFADVKVQ
jgi:hypothetical protein